MRSFEKHITDDLLVKYLVGETTETESRQAEQWINASDANQKYYAGLKLIWQESERITADSKVNEDDAWLHLQNRINKNAKDVQKPSLFMGRQWLKIAASILFICLAAYLTYDHFYNNRMIDKLSGDQVLTANLSDGSTITLNNHSKISYPARFKGSERLVKLTGEAFFKVKPDKSKPFIISVKDATISVVGTSFDIRNRKNETEVIVATGIVKVKAYGKEILLYPGEKVTVTETGNDLVKQQNKGSLYNYYMTGALVCDQTPLYQLVDKLNEVYKVHIEITNQQLKNLPITTTFKGQSLDEVLQIIAETFNIKIERHGNRFLIK